MNSFTLVLFFAVALSACNSCVITNCCNKGLTNHRSQVKVLKNYGLCRHKSPVTYALMKEQPSFGSSVSIDNVEDEFKTPTCATRTKYREANDGDYEVEISKESPFVTSITLPKVDDAKPAFECACSKPAPAPAPTPSLSLPIHLMASAAPAYPYPQQYVSYSAPAPAPVPAPAPQSAAPCSGPSVCVSCPAPTPVVSYQAPAPAPVAQCSAPPPPAPQQPANVVYYSQPAPQPCCNY